MRVLVLTPYLYGTAPGPRTSIELWPRVLEPAGISFVFAPFESERLHEIIYRPGHTAEKAAEMVKAYGRRLRELRHLEDFDAVLVYREAALIGPALLERLAARGGKPLIYQLDDPLYIPYRSPANGYLSYLKFFGKVRTLCRMSRVVIVNSPQHQDFASRYNANVWLVPSVVDAEQYSGQAPRGGGDGEPVCVGWTGSASTAANLSVIGGVLRWLGDRDDVRLRFIGGEPPGLDGVRYEVREWRADTEIEDLRELEVGLLPLPVTEWTKRKFYMKLVQYMALGIPPVATPLGANPEVIEPGVTGYLARDEREWREHLEALIADPALRREMGERAAARARERYTLQANAETIVAAIRSAVG